MATNEFLQGNSDILTHSIIHDVHPRRKFHSVSHSEAREIDRTNSILSKSLKYNLTESFAILENESNWKYSPEQNKGLLVAVKDDILDSIFEEDERIWTLCQTPVITERAHQPNLLNEGRALFLIENNYLFMIHSSKLEEIHEFFRSLTKVKVKVKLSMASPAYWSSIMYNYPNKIRPINNGGGQSLTATIITSHPGHHDSIVEEESVSLTDLTIEKRRSLELAFLCAEFPVLSAPPPPEYDFDVFENTQLNQIYIPKQLQQDNSNAMHTSQNASIEISSSIIRDDDTISQASTGTFDTAIKINSNENEDVMPKSEIVSKYLQNGIMEIEPDHVAVQKKDPAMSEYMYAETTEMLLEHLKTVYGLSKVDFRDLARSVRAKSTKMSRGKSSTLYKELLLRLTIIEKNEHPYYRPSAFPSKASYDMWMRDEKQTIFELINKFYHETGNLNPSIPNNVHLPGDLHRCYSSLLRTLLRYELDNTLEGYNLSANVNTNIAEVTNNINNVDGQNVEMDSNCSSNIDSQYLNVFEQYMFSPCTLRLLKEYKLRYGINETYTHLALIDNLAFELSDLNNKNGNKLDRLLSLLISELSQMCNILTARVVNKTTKTLILLRQEKNMLILTTEKIIKAIKNLFTGGIERVINKSVTFTRGKANISSLLSSSIVLLEIAFNTHHTASNIGQTSTRTKSSSIKDLLLNWLQKCIAEAYGQLKLRVANEFQENQNFTLASATLGPVVINKLLSLVTREIKRIRDIYQMPLRNYLNITHFVTSEYYSLIIQDVLYVCKRQCNEIEAKRAIGGQIDRESLETNDINLMGLMHNLDEVDNQIWTGALPENVITWRKDILKLFQIKWNLAIESQIINKIKEMIAQDSWIPLDITRTPEEAKEQKIQSNKMKQPYLTQKSHSQPHMRTGNIMSEKSAFTAPRRHSYPHNTACPPLDDAVINCAQINATPGFNRHNKVNSPLIKPASEQDEVMMNNKSAKLSSGDEDRAEITEYRDNSALLDENHIKMEHNLMSSLSTVPPEGVSDREIDIESTKKASENKIIYKKSKIITENISNLPYALPVSNSLIDIIICISRYIATVSSLLQTLSPLKCSRYPLRRNNPDELPLDIIENSRIANSVKDTNDKMRRELIKSALITLSRVCLNYTYNILNIDLCGHSQELIVLIAGKETKAVLNDIAESNRRKEFWGCKHIINMNMRRPLWRKDTRHQVITSCGLANAKSKNKIEKVTKDRILRINNLCAIQNIWAKVDFQLSKSMNNQKLLPHSSFNWTTSSYHETSPKNSEITNYQTIDENNELEYVRDSRENAAKDEIILLTSEKIRTVIEIELKLIAHQIGTSFMHLFNFLIDLKLPDYQAREKIAPALNYLSACLGDLAKLLYPEPFQYLLKLLWKKIIFRLENKAINILEQTSSINSSCNKTKMYLEILTDLTNYFVSTKGKIGLNLELLASSSEFLSTILSFNFLGGTTLVKMLNALLEDDANNQYRITINDINTANNDDECGEISINSAISADTGLTKFEVIAYLIKKLNGDRKTFFGEDLIMSLIQLRNETLDTAWKTIQDDWYVPASMICQNLLTNGDIMEVCTPGMEEMEDDRGKKEFKCNNFYILVINKRIVLPINNELVCITTVNNNDMQSDSAENAVFKVKSKVGNVYEELDEARWITIAYIYSILKQRKEHNGINYTSNNTEEKIITYIKYPLNKLLILNQY